MRRSVVMTPFTDGFARVRAVVSRTEKNRKPMSREILVPSEDIRSTRRLLGCALKDGEFIRPEVILKRERVVRRESAIVDRLVWSYYEFKWGNSLSHVGRETVLWLKKAGVPIQVLPWYGEDDGKAIATVATEEDLRSSAVIVMARVPVPDQVFRRLRSAPFVAAYYMLDGTLPKEPDIDILEGYDAVFVPSTFCRDALLEGGLTTPVYLWGHGYDPAIFPYTEKRQEAPFTFLWFGVENRRKGFDLFLEAFSRIKDPSVRAWVRCPAVEGQGGIGGTRNRYKSDRRIVWDTRVTPPEQLREIMRESDVIVCPLRAEGFNIPMLEAMACGKPAICTRFSGPLDFGGDDSLTYWVDVEGWEPSQTDLGNQAVPSMDSLVSKMEWCAAHPEEVRKRGRRAHDHAHASWRWDQKVLDVLPVLKSLIPKFEIPVPWIAPKT